MFKQEEKGFGIPAAIVVAGLIIALAIVFGGGNKTSVNTNTNVGNGSAPEEGKTLVEIVEDLGIDEGDFAKCIEDSSSLAKVNDDISGISSIASQPGFGTPYNVVIDTQTGATVPVVGAQPFENVQKLVELILSDDPSVADLSVDLDIPEITADDHVKGNSEGRIKIVEYSDFDCPFCGRFHVTMNQVIAEYGEDVAWTYRHFPLEQIHPNAKQIAVASECIAELGGNDAFWEFSDIAFNI